MKFEEDTEGFKVTFQKGDSILSQQLAWSKYRELIALLRLFERVQPKEK